MVPEENSILDLVVRVVSPADPLGEILILDQSGAGLVDVFALRLVLSRQASVRVPAAMEDLNVAYASLGEPTGIQTAGGESAGRRGARHLRSFRV